MKNLIIYSNDKRKFYSNDRINFRYTSLISEAQRFESEDEIMEFMKGASKDISISILMVENETIFKGKIWDGVAFLYPHGNWKVEYDADHYAVSNQDIFKGYSTLKQTIKVKFRFKSNISVEVMEIIPS